MWSKLYSGSYSGVDLIESLHHKSYHNFYPKAIVNFQSHHPKVGNNHMTQKWETVQKWKTVPIIKKVAISIETVSFFRRKLSKTYLFCTILKILDFVHRYDGLHDLSKPPRLCIKFQTTALVHKIERPIAQNGFET